MDNSSPAYEGAPLDDEAFASFMTESAEITAEEDRQRQNKFLAIQELRQVLAEEGVDCLIIDEREKIGENVKQEAARLFEEIMPGYEYDPESPVHDGLLMSCFNAAMARAQYEDGLVEEIVNYFTPYQSRDDVMSNEEELNEVTASKKYMMARMYLSDKEDAGMIDSNGWGRVIDKMLLGEPFRIDDPEDFHYLAKAYMQVDSKDLSRPPTTRDKIRQELGVLTLEEAQNEPEEMNRFLTSSYLIDLLLTKTEGINIDDDRSVNNLQDFARKTLLDFDYPAEVHDEIIALLLQHAQNATR